MSDDGKIQCGRVYLGQRCELWTHGVDDTPHTIHAAGDLTWTDEQAFLNTPPERIATALERIALALEKLAGIPS